MDFCDITISFFRITADFRDEVTRYKNERKYNFDKIDELGQNLFRLKNAVHNTVDDKNNDLQNVDEIDLFDLIIGSIFHEMLHLKEFVYILQSYEPRYLAFAQQAGSRRLTGTEKDFIHHSLQIVDQAKLGLPEKTKELEDLFPDALHQLERVIRHYRDNDRLVRCLWLSRAVLGRVYGQGGLSRLYGLIFDQGAIEGYCRTGESFLKAGFNSEAVLAFDEAEAIVGKLSPEDPSYANRQELIEKIKFNSICAQLKA